MTAKIVRFALPGLPLLIAAFLSVAELSYLRPLLTTAGGLVAALVVLALAVGGWLVYPTILRVQPGPAAWLARGLWVVAVTIPGTLIVVMGPAIIVVSRALGLAG